MYLAPESGSSDVWAMADSMPERVPQEEEGGKKKSLQLITH